MPNVILQTLPYVPNKVAFSLGSFSVAWYAIFIFIGFFLAIVFACIKLSKWYKVSYDPFFYFIFIGIPVSILGARAWSFIIGDAKISTNFFIDFWQFQNGGMAIQGGILFTVIAALIWFPLILKRPKYQVKTNIDNKYYIKQVSMWVYFDAIVPCILLGQIVGRWGNFMNQELYGALVTDPFVSMSWLQTVMPDVFYGMFINGDINNFHQPLFLYESFANFWIFLFLYVGCEFIKFRKAGDIGILYFVTYGILRLALEPLRASQYTFPLNIAFSIIFIVGGILLILVNHLFFAKHRNKKYLFEYWIYFSFFFKKIYMNINKEYRNRLLDIDPKLDNYGYKKRPVFIRENDEIYYYNGY